MLPADATDIGNILDFMSRQACNYENKKKEAQLALREYNRASKKRKQMIDLWQNVGAMVFEMNRSRKNDILKTKCRKCYLWVKVKKWAFKRGRLEAIISFWKSYSAYKPMQQATREILKGFLNCAFSQRRIKNPVVASDGHTYEKETIANERFSPITSEFLKSSFIDDKFTSSLMQALRFNDDSIVRKLFRKSPQGFHNPFITPKGEVMEFAELTASEQVCSFPCFAARLLSVLR
jgi:hypothetical protein